MSTLSYQEFLKAVQLRFAMIEVNKSHKASKRKDAEEALNIHNEIKIITASQETFDLCSELISSQSHGELIKS